MKGKLWILPLSLLATSYGYAHSSKHHFESFHATVLANQQSVTGQVKDANTGEPLVGVTIAVKGENKAVQTDANGKFNLAVQNGQILRITYLGYVRQEFTVKQGSIQIALVSEDAALEEVVVVGYGTQKKSEITSAVASVKEKDFNQGGMRSPLDLVQGKVAGLNITRTQGSNPNSGTSIQLRGISSISGSTSPLVVIDGIPGGNLDLLKQGDIETIDVLKDGSAAAIYGTRANGGVILITTKKGKSGSSTFDYMTYGQREFVGKRPQMLSADRFRELVVKGLDRPDLDFGASTDLYNEVIDKNNFSHFHNFSASGGGEKSTYRASINYEDANGIAKQNGRKQFGGRLNLTQTGLKDRLTLSTNIAANFNKSNLLGGKTEYFEQAIQRNPTAPIYNSDGTFFQTQGWNNFNPMDRLANRIDERDQQTFSGDASLRLKIIDQLSVKAFGSYVRDNWNDRQYRSTKDWDQRLNTDYQGMGYAFKRNELSWTKTFESTIDYNQTFNDVHKVTGLLGYSYQYSTYENFQLSNNGFTTDATLDWNMGSGTAINNTKLPRPGLGSFKEDNTLVAFFGRVNYAFADKYFATAILRREGSSRFGSNNKWGNFPAISAGWNISREEFFTKNNIVNDLKLRVGYGVTGNQGFPNYQSLILLGTGGVYPIDGVYFQTYGLNRNPNPNLQWEQKAETNIGLDFSLFNSRISGSLDVYKRNTSNLLFQYQTQQPAFVTSDIWYNVGEISNKGVELTLAATAYQRGDFKWDIQFAGNYQKNKIVKLSNDTFKSSWINSGELPTPGALGNAIRVEEGGEIGNFYGKRFAGFNESGEWLFYKADGSKGKATEMNENDLGIIGNGVPKYQASLSNRFYYKGFDLTVFLRGKFKYDILNTGDMFFGNKKWLPNNVFESAFGKNDKLDDSPQYSNYYLENGSFVKLDNVTLGYTFKLKNDYIRNLNIYVSGRNLAVITKYSGLDPELKDTGFDSGIDSRSFYPRTRSWAVGLNVSF